MLMLNSYSTRGKSTSRRQRLFVYGSLKPGGRNEHVLQPLGGQWQPATVKGRIIQPGWGRGVDYPGLVLDDEADDVPGLLFSADGLHAEWRALDRFEGPDYERVTAEAHLPGGGIESVQVYVIRGGP